MHNSNVPKGFGMGPTLDILDSLYWRDTFAKSSLKRYYLTFDFPFTLFLLLADGTMEGFCKICVIKLMKDNQIRDL